MGNRQAIIKPFLTHNEARCIVVLNTTRLKRYEPMDKTSTGLTENVAGLLCYVLGWVSGIVFILIERENKFVRFHAIPSIIVFGVLNVAGIVLGWILGWIPVLGSFVSAVIAILAFILWIVLMVKAYRGIKYKIPWAGDFADR